MGYGLWSGGRSGSSSSLVTPDDSNRTELSSLLDSIMDMSTSPPRCSPSSCAPVTTSQLLLLDVVRLTGVDASADEGGRSCGKGRERGDMGR